MNLLLIGGVLGGIGLFLLGMRLMTDGLKVSAGAMLREILSRWTRTRFRGLCSGILITGIVQSSSAVTVATIGFVNAGVMTLGQAMWVIFGSNIGTTMTGWIVAIVGFVLSFLLFLAPLGVVLGIVGIFRTGRGSRRGRGLAIAAIPIGMVMSGFVAMIGVTGYHMFATVRRAAEIAAVLQTSSVRISEEATEFYDHQPRRFQLAVSRGDFEAWLAAAIQKHGSLQSVKPATRAVKIDPITREWTINLVGEFVNGSAHVGVVFAPPGAGEPQLRDISVDGVSATGGDNGHGNGEAPPPDKSLTGGLDEPKTGGDSL